MNIDAYNPAIAYLKDKYGSTQQVTQMRGGIIANSTYNLGDYKNWPHEDQGVHLLVTQYCLGIKPKEELYNLLCSIGVMQPEN